MLNVGPNGTVLTADSSPSTGVSWGQVTSAGISTGAVTPSKLSTGAPTWTSAGVVSATSFSGALIGNADTVTNGVYTTNFANSFTGTGYQKFPGGFTIQWGTTGGLGQASQFQAFATPFTAGVFSVQVTPNGGGGNSGDKRDHWVASNWTLGGFTLTSWFENGSASYSWIAIGV